MITVKVNLNSIDAVKSFVNTVSKYDVDFDLVSGRYMIDAKSIMGVFSLNLSKPIILNIHTDENTDSVSLDFSKPINTDKNVESILEALKPYIVE